MEFDLDTDYKSQDDMTSFHFQSSEAKAFRQELNKIIDPKLVRSWFAECEFDISSTESRIVIVHSKRFNIDYIERNFETEVRSTFQNLYGHHYTVRFRHDPARDALRPLPVGDDQYDFFVPALSETALRDEIHLMEIAPFTLSKRESRTKIEYKNVTGMNLTITCNPDYGMMTAHDYDFVLMMMSHLNEKANHWRYSLEAWKKRGSKGPEPERPSRQFRPTTGEILKFMRKHHKGGKGGNTYKQIEAMLDRLDNCTAKVERTGRRKRRAGTFSFIHNYETVSRSDTGNILQVSVTVPDWIYDGIVREDYPHLLTIDPDYLLLQRPMGKFLYRLAKIKAKKENVELSLDDVYERSGSTQPKKAFNRDLASYIDDLIELEGTERRFPDYSFMISGSARKRHLFIQFRDQYVATSHASL